MYLDGAHELYVVPLVVLFGPVIAAKSHRRLARAISLLAHNVRALCGQESWIQIMAISAGESRAFDGSDGRTRGSECLARRNRPAFCGRSTA